MYVSLWVVLHASVCVCVCVCVKRLQEINTNVRTFGYFLVTQFTVFKLFNRLKETLSGHLERKSLLTSRTASDRWTEVEESQRTASTSRVFNQLKGRGTSLVPFTSWTPSRNLEDVGGPCCVGTLLSALGDCLSLLGRSQPPIYHINVLAEYSHRVINCKCMFSLPLATAAVWSDGKVASKSTGQFRKWKSRRGRFLAERVTVGSELSWPWLCALFQASLFFHSSFLKYHHLKAYRVHLKAGFHPTLNPHV